MLAELLAPLIAGLDAVGRELLLFAGIWIVVGLIDEMAIDLLWFWLRLRGRGRALRFNPTNGDLGQGAAIFIPCWHEERVIAETIRHARLSWPHPRATFYVGCYPNDPATQLAVEQGAGGDPRVRLVVLERAGPSTKADCLNALYRTMQRDVAEGAEVGFVVLHDAEDHVHPAGLELIADRLQRADYVQLPVIPEVDPGSRWVAGHYLDEFAENHRKTMVVRDWLRTSLPAAGVGCAFRTEILSRIAAYRGSDVPFEAQSLTEDYELGMLVTELGGTSRFVTARDSDGELIATREFFPATLDAATRQKARWLHGIAFQGWDRLGWSRKPAEFWMRLRDRRGPLIAIVLAAAYALLVIWLIVQIAIWLDVYRPPQPHALLTALVVVTTFGLAWRAIMRFAFTAAQYGLGQGLLAVLRMPLANIIAIVSARRAFAAYIASLRGGATIWEKTAHHRHPAQVGGLRTERG